MKEVVTFVLKKIDEAFFSDTLGNVSLHMKLSSFASIHVEYIAVRSA